MRTNMMKALFTVFLLLTSTLAWSEPRVFNDFYGEVVLPAEPKRIVSLQDHVLTMSLVELGAPVIGSAGRVDGSGKPYLRGVNQLLGVDFDNSNIQFVGTYGAADIEAIVLLEPDLIITTHWESTEQLDSLRKIAPTVAINQDQILLDFMRDVAVVANRLPEYESRLLRYKARLVEAKDAISNPTDITISVINTWDGQLTYWSSYGALTQVMNDIGFARPVIHSKAIDGSLAISSEELPLVDATYIFDTYGVSWGDTPASARAGMAKVLPSWCEVLTACHAGRYIAFPRTYVFSTSFASLELATQLIVSHVAGRQ